VDIYDTAYVLNNTSTSASTSTSNNLYITHEYGHTSTKLRTIYDGDTVFQNGEEIKIIDELYKCNSVVILKNGHLYMISTKIWTIVMTFVENNGFGDLPLSEYVDKMLSDE